MTKKIDISANDFTEIINTRSPADVLYYLAYSYKQEAIRSIPGSFKESFCNEIYKKLINESDKLFKFQKEMGIP